MKFTRDGAIWLVLFLGGVAGFLGGHFDLLTKAFGLGPVWQARIELVSALCGFIGAFLRMSPFALSSQNPLATTQSSQSLTMTGKLPLIVLACLLGLPATVSAQPVRDVPDVLSYGTAVINPGWAAWRAYKSADPACGLSKLAISEAIGNGVVLVMKHFVNSPRPCHGCTPDGNPSGHSMNGAIGAFSNGGWGFALTVPTPFLRVGANRHTTTQAVVGTLIGVGADAFGQFVMKCGS